LQTEPGPIIVVRADASAKIGGGHIMRCLALADALCDRGATCWFAGLPDTIATVPALDQSRYHWLALEPPGGASALRLALVEAGVRTCDWLIVDHYQWTAVDEGECRAWARNIMVIDDLANRQHDCDLLLDQTLGRGAGEYANLVPIAAKKLLGTAYALLRPEFSATRARALRRRSAGRIDRVLVAMGLTDSAGATRKVVEQLLACGVPFKIDIAIGAAAPHLDDIVSLVSSNKEILKLHIGSRTMAALMSNADICVGAAGSSSWERCCVGLPSILLVIADNQRQIAKQLEAASAVILLGGLDDLEARSVAEPLMLLRESPELLVRMSESAAAICDGRGTTRAAEWIVS
jgi:UDP-2,4-diacetamido-2,4,6-trideoxy-beta-L-altropyranose hydrolase